MNKAQKLARQLKRKAKTRSWRQIAREDYDGRIHFSVLNKIANTDGKYIPPDKETRYLLGLYKPRPITPRTINNNEQGQSWTLYMREKVKSMRTPTPKELSQLCTCLYPGQLTKDFVCQKCGRPFLRKKKP
jgi:hypothetical protein